MLRSMPPIEEGAQTGLAQVPLTIRSASGDHRFMVEIAATLTSRSGG